MLAPTAPGHAITQGCVSMKRSTGPITLVFTLVACPLLAAEPASPRQTLADRIGALREGWTFSTDQPEPDSAPMTTPQRVAQRQAAATASDTPRAFPRVNPRELLPRNWFGAPSGQASRVTPGARRGPRQLSDRFGRFGPRPAAA